MISRFEEDSNGRYPPDQVRIGWKDRNVSIVGLHTIVVAALVAALSWMGYLLNKSVDGTIEAIKQAVEEHGQQQTNEHVAISDEIRRNLGRMAEGQGKIAEAMDAQTYLLTKTDKERQLYKLDMPESLRRRIR